MVIAPHAVMYDCGLRAYSKFYPEYQAKTFLGFLFNLDRWKTQEVLDVYSPRYYRGEHNKILENLMHTPDFTVTAWGILDDLERAVRWEKKNKSRLSEEEYTRLNEEVYVPLWRKLEKEANPAVPQVSVLKRRLTNCW